MTTDDPVPGIPASSTANQREQRIAAWVSIEAEAERTGEVARCLLDDIQAGRIRRRDARDALWQAEWERDRLVEMTVAAMAVGITPSELAQAAGHENSLIVEGILVVAREEAARRRRSWAADRALRRLARACQEFCVSGVI